jgi:lysophosphatidate acyltransferase
MPPVSYYLRLSLYTSAMGFASACGVGISIIATLLGQRLNINWYVARLFYRLASPLVGIKCIVEGEEHLKALMSVEKGEKAKSAVLLGNHQRYVDALPRRQTYSHSSFLDILYLGRIFPQKASIMAKKELKWVPFLGQFSA